MKMYYLLLHSIEFFFLNANFIVVCEWHCLEVQRNNTPSLGLQNNKVRMKK